MFLVSCARLYWRLAYKDYVIYGTATCCYDRTASLLAVPLRILSQKGSER